jgi:hypothetical protein
MLEFLKMAEDTLAREEKFKMEREERERIDPSTEGIGMWGLDAYEKIHVGHVQPTPKRSRETPSPAPAAEAAFRASFVTEVAPIVTPTETPTETPPLLRGDPNTDDEFSDLSDTDPIDQPPDLDPEFDAHPLLMPDELDEKIAELPMPDVLVIDEPATPLEITAGLEPLPTPPAAPAPEVLSPRSFPAPVALAERGQERAKRTSKTEKTGAEKKNVAGRRMQDAQSFAKTRGPSPRKSTPRKSRPVKPA